MNADELSDREFILQPKLWPNYPLLPVKRYVGNESECCFIAAINLPKIRVMGVNLFKFADYVKSGGEHFADEVNNCPKYDYNDVDAFLADGWVVD
jgi:hypothetical protein